MPSFTGNKLISLRNKSTGTELFELILFKCEIRALITLQFLQVKLIEIRVSLQFDFF